MPFHLKKIAWQNSSTQETEDVYEMRLKESKLVFKRVVFAFVLQYAKISNGQTIL